MVRSLLTSFFAPIAKKLKIYSKEESLNKRMIIEGIMAIQQGDNPRIVERKLSVFLSPSMRGSAEEGRPWPSSKNAQNVPKVCRDGCKPLATSCRFCCASLFLLLSFSTMKKEDFEKAVGSLQGALGVLPGEPILSSPIKLQLPIVRGDLTEARPTLKEAKSELEKQVEAEGQQENVEIIESEDGITIRIKDNAVFSKRRCGN